MCQVTELRPYASARKQGLRLGLPQATVVRMVARERAAGLSGNSVAGELRQQAMQQRTPPAPGAA